MGLITSRLNFDVLHPGRRRSQQDETLYSYSLNKNYFSNYFLMGGERFEVNDPDYLFGDSCDLNFLSCTKPYSIPYKEAQQNLLANLNAKQKAINKVSSRLNSPFDILPGRHRRNPNRRKQDAQTQTLNNNSKGCLNGSQPSKPLVMFVNIRKETLRLVKSSNACNLDSDLENGLNNSVSISRIDQKSVLKLTKKRSSLKQSNKPSAQQEAQSNLNRHSASSSLATTATYPNEVALSEGVSPPGSCAKKFESDVSSLLSATSSIRSGYTSVREDSIGMHEVINNNVSSEDDDEDFKDALNDTTNLSTREDDDEDSEKAQQQKSLLSKAEDKPATNDDETDRDIRITIPDSASASNINSETMNKRAESSGSLKGSCYEDGCENIHLKKYPNQRSKTRDSSSSQKLAQSDVKTTIDDNEPQDMDSTTNKVYNIEFNFDAEVDCSIRIFYFCTRELTSNGITYKPQHATYKSRIYYYKKGMNQKFDQQEHTFQPYLFDEDLLIYKPLDLDGNYNSGAVFPIVIHCVALEGQAPKQSHSLVATIEKSQLDDSYSIKPLKQLIFVDGVQYILQDIYGIEHKQLTSSKTPAPKSVGPNASCQQTKAHSLQSNLNNSNLNLNTSDNASLSSVDFSLHTNRQNRGSLISNQHKSLGSENTFECVICMSEERDTMLLPCRHLCLCSSCAQSLRYQANSCPICRCSFKAALNLRPITHRHSSSMAATKPLVTSSSPTVSTSRVVAATTRQAQESNTMNTNVSLQKHDASKRRESLTTSTTPLLSSTPTLEVVVNLDGRGNSSAVATTISTPPTITLADTPPSTTVSMSSSRSNKC